MARSAGLLSMGNATSRILGLVREIVIAAFFGATGQVSAFRVASQVPVLLYDFLVGGMLSAALVPVLSDYAQRRRRSEYAELVSLVLSLFALVLALLVLLLEAFAPQLAWLMAAGFRESDPELLILTTQLIRVVAPAVWLFSMAGLFTAMLYSLKRFAFPAMATAVYNLGHCNGGAPVGRAYWNLQLGCGDLVGWAGSNHPDGVGSASHRAVHPAALQLATSSVTAHCAALSANCRWTRDQPYADCVGPKAGQWNRRTEYRLDEQCDHPAADAAGSDQRGHFTSRPAPT